MNVHGDAVRQIGSNTYQFAPEAIPAPSMDADRGGDSWLEGLLTLP